MITFFRVIDTGIGPQKADKSANGTIPTNGYRFCEPVRTANSFGWYVFLPLEFWLLFDGSEIQWSLDQGDNWYVLADAIQYPDFAARFDAAAPEEVRGYSPPFLSRTNDLDIVQVWTGNFARTQQGIGSYVRGPVNLPNGMDHVVLEGVVQTEWWFGPLFANVRILKRGSPVIFRTDRPFLQVQPFSNALMREFEAAEIAERDGLEGMTAAEWRDYRATIVRRMQTRTRLGQYAAEARKRSGAENKATEPAE
jgi:hypothetical protein